MDPRYPHAGRGILLILLATCCFGCLDTMSKYLVAYYPASALVWLRYVLQTVVMAAIFFLVMTPIGLCFRLVGRDALGRKLEPNRTSYWRDRGPARDPSSYFKLY